MSDFNPSLQMIFEGWDGFQTSIVHAVAPLSQEQLNWRPAPSLRSVGETVGHIAIGRVDWFKRMGAPGSQELAKRFTAFHKGRVYDPNPSAKDAAELVEWLETSWEMIAENLKNWKIPDLFVTYQHEYRGKVYAISRQWTIWRILSHDIQHGGQIAQMLGMQGIAVPELGDLGGHLTEPPLADIE